jgi:3-hydroxyisobutyrate dehydrogenase|tara:strand:- start:1431 stop:2330 length:900 start_codon:yes stop_codon:yes gene_type:complete
MPKHAFLGMGIMGASMAANLGRSALKTNIWNRTNPSPGIQIAKRAGCNVVKSIEEAVNSVDFIFTCVSDAPDVEKVLFSSGGVVENAKKGALIIDFSTIGSKAAKSFGHRLKQIGLRFLDAPVSGGDIGAKNGSLTIMAGGTDKDFSDSLPILKVLGENIHHCGPVGSGQAVKLVNQILGGIHMVALSEAMRLAEIQEIDPNLIVEICSTGAAGSWALSNLGPKMIQSDYSAGFKVKDMLKDLRLVHEELLDREILPGVNLAQKLFELVITTFPQDQGGLMGTQSMVLAYKNGLQNELK